MNIKKIFLRTLFIIISILLIMSLCGCAGQDTETTTAAATTTVPFEESTTSAETTAPKASTTNETTAKATETQNSDKESKKATTKKAKSKQTTKPSTTKRRTQENATTVAEHCYDDNSHSMPTGNMGKWFNSRNELVEYYNDVVNKWNNKADSGEITEEEYAKNCPAGYESWSCAYCDKWTGNFKYN